MTIKFETKCYWEDSGGGTMLTDQDMNRSWERQRSFEPFFIWKQKMRSNWNCFVYCGCMQERSCNKDYCGGISCEGLLKIRRMWQWQLPQLLVSHSGGLQNKKTQTPKDNLVRSEISCHTLIVRIQHFTYGYVMYIRGRVQVLRMPFPSTFDSHW